MQTYGIEKLGIIGPKAVYRNLTPAQLTEAALPIEKYSVPTYEAVRKFRAYRMYDKEQLFGYRRVSRVNLYNLEGFEDYF